MASLRALRALICQFKRPNVSKTRILVPKVLLYDPASIGLKKLESKNILVSKVVYVYVKLRVELLSSRTLKSLDFFNKHFQHVEINIPVPILELNKCISTLNCRFFWSRFSQSLFYYRFLWRNSCTWCCWVRIYKLFAICY